MLSEKVNERMRGEAMGQVWNAGDKVVSAAGSNFFLFFPFSLEEDVIDSFHHTALDMRHSARPLLLGPRFLP